MRRHYSPDAYDGNGLLRLPCMFWLILLIQARTWLILIMAGASRQQGNDLLSLFYPEPYYFWAGLIIGIPALFSLVLAGYRQRCPVLWRLWRWVPGCSVTGSLIFQIGQIAQAGMLITESSPWFIFSDVLSLAYLAGSSRLHDCFNPHYNLND